MSFKTIASAGLIALSAGAIAIGPVRAASSVDPDGDGSISLQEAHAAAAKKFDRLDAAHKGKLTERQLSPISKAMGEMAAHDVDHSVDKTEYMAGVDAAFKEADPNGTGVLNADALKTEAGKKFLRLVE